ncbi:MAG: helix-turn-helix domain-containing protein [Desulfobaccales bacterium]
MLKDLLEKADFLTPADLAQGLKVSRAAVSQWVRQGKIPFLQIERCIRFDPGEIREWLKARRRGT